MNFPKCLYKENFYLIVPDKAHYNGAMAEGWQESHAHIVGLPDKYLGKKPAPIADTPVFDGPTFESAPTEEEIDKEMAENPPTEEELMELFKKDNPNGRPMRGGEPTSSFLAWKEKHGYDA